MALGEARGSATKGAGLGFPSSATGTPPSEVTLCKVRNLSIAKDRNAKQTNFNIK